MHKTYEAILDLLIAADKKTAAHQFDQCEALLEQTRAKLEQTSFNELKNDYYDGWGYFYKQYVLLLKQRIAIEHLGVPPNAVNGPEYLGWAWYYLGHQQTVSSLALHQVLLKTVRTVLDTFMTKDKDLLYSSCYISLRALFRSSHALLSLEALCAGDLKLAVAEIERCFKIKSGYSEYLDPYIDYYETSATVYQAAYLQDPAKYGKKYFEALLKLEKKAEDEYYVSITNPALQAAIASPDYQAFKQGAPIEKLRHGKAGETWQQAIARFKAMHKLLKVAPEDEDDYDWNQLTINARETEAHLAEIESQINCPIPASLRDLLCNTGALQMRDSEEWGSITLYSNVDGGYMPTAAGLAASIDHVWGGRPEFEDYFKPSEIDDINQRFFCFGAYLHDSNAHTHYYFTRAGRFGALYYNQDEWDNLYTSLKALMADETPGDYDTLDALLSSGVDDVIEALLAWKEENDQGA
ncbi:hypothetical protein [Chitinimonas naiadis]